MRDITNFIVSALDRNGRTERRTLGLRPSLKHELYTDSWRNHQYSEIILPKRNDHSDIEIINAALKRDYNNAIHKPGRNKYGRPVYKHTMAGVRDSENGVNLPPHDVEPYRKRVDRGCRRSFRIRRRVDGIPVVCRRS